VCNFVALSNFQFCEGRIGYLILLSASFIVIYSDMDVCKQKGCRKCARWPYMFCSKHAPEEDYSHPRLELALLAKAVPRQQAGFFRQFLFENGDVIRGINGIVAELMNHMHLNTGHWVFSYLTIKDVAAIEPFLNLIVEQARLQISFPQKTNTRIQETKLVVAPPEGGRSNSWTKGKIHCDFSSPEVPGGNSFLLCFDEITEVNGAIDIWRKSKYTPYNNKTTNRGLDGVAVQTLLGAKNTVFVWDSRLLHQPLPNTSSFVRSVLIWLVSSKSKLYVVIF
jgi:hypothetical protein